VTHEALQIWTSDKESDEVKVIFFNEAVRQGHIVIHWESFYDGPPEVIVLNEETS
jgi:hypothetical protein